jgi:hypothetical protein
MKVTEIWRYRSRPWPVRSCSGYASGLGIEGDRIVHVEDAHQRVITSRSHPRFLGHQGRWARMANRWWMGDPGTARKSPPRWWTLSD